MSEDRFESESGRYVVQKQKDGKIHVYDTLKFEKIGNPWLEAVAADFISREDLGNRNVFLSDDLKFVLVDPKPMWNTEKFGPNGKHMYITQFERAGKNYLRAKHFLTYSRPDKNPVIHELAPENAKHENGDPFNLPRLLTIDGELRFCRRSALLIELLNLDFHVVESHSLSTSEVWTTESGTRWKNDPERKRVVICSAPLRVDERPVRLAIWPYHSHKITQYELRVDELFDKEKRFAPKNPVPVEAPPSTPAHNL
jgi:hypothetical protein